MWAGRHSGIPTENIAWVYGFEKGAGNNIRRVVNQYFVSLQMELFSLNIL